MPHQSAPVKGPKSPFKFVLPYVIAIILNLHNPDNLQAQTLSSCANADFESGDFTNWQGQIGSCCPVSTNPSGIVHGRHTIMSGTGTDPNTCGHVTVVAPGGNYSARIGNSEIGAEAEKLSYAITVSPTSALFIYRYAVVLEDPGHPADEQPRFQIRVLDADGHLIDPVCGQYTVVASSDLPGFQTCNGSIVYKDWTTVGLDLSAQMGQTLTIEFATGDCTPGGHFGYAYVDAYCSPLRIDATYCSGSFSATLSAPIGFSYLWSTGETTQEIHVSNPIGGQTYACQMTSVTGCVVNISTVLAVADPVADFAVTNTCFDSAQFSDISFMPGSRAIDTFAWDFGDGTVSSERNPEHVFPAVGTYNVSFSISNGSGCASTVTHLVTVYPPPNATIVYPQSPYCTTVTAYVPVQLNGTEDYTGGVFSSTPGLAINPSNGAILPSRSLPGNYTVTYTVPTTADNCTAVPVTTTVVITAVPTVEIRYPDAVYCKDVSQVLPMVSGTHAFLGGTYSAPAGLSIDPTTGVVDPSASKAGSYLVTYQTPDFGGCAPVKATTNLIINPLPEPQLSDGTICVNADGTVFRTHLFDTGLNDVDYTFEWYLDDVLIASATQYKYEPTGVGNYAVVATNVHTGCQSEKQYASVNQFFIPDDFIAYLSNPFTDRAALHLVVKGGTGPYLFSIDGGPFESQDVYTELAPGTHTIQVTDASNCTNLTKEILVLDYPKFFTPNRDGYHDTWNIFRLGDQPDAVINIYDRYGKLLKQIRPSGEGWDGSCDGRDMPSDDYWFTVDYREMDVKGVMVRKRYRSHFAMKR